MGRAGTYNDSDENYVPRVPEIDFTPFRENIFDLQME